MGTSPFAPAKPRPVPLRFPGGGGWEAVRVLVLLRGREWASGELRTSAGGLRTSTGPGCGVLNPFISYPCT